MLDICFPPIVFSLRLHIARMICNRFQIYITIVIVFFSIIGNILPKILYFFVNIILFFLLKNTYNSQERAPISSLQGLHISFLFFNYIDSGASTPTRLRAFFNVIIVAFTKPKRWFVNSGSSGLFTRELL